MTRGNSPVTGGGKGRGGRRDGAGRPQGVKNVSLPSSTSSFRARQALAEKIGSEIVNEMDVLDIMQTVVRVAFAQGDYQVASRAADIVLPYLHPRAKFNKDDNAKENGAERLTEQQLVAIISTASIPKHQQSTAEVIDAKEIIERKRA